MKYLIDGDNRHFFSELCVLGEFYTVFEEPIDICHTAIEILQGRDVFTEHKDDLIKGLKEHMELEEDSIKRANTMLKSVWISENQALKVLIEKLRDDERRHHNSLKKLSENPFFRIDPRDFTVIIRGEEFAEARYRRSKEFREKKERDKEETD